MLAAVAVACGPSYFEIPIETPIQPKMDVSPFQRVLVAGFVAGGTDDVDTNLETVRLLRSQLRSKSSLRVIDADVMPLARDRAGPEPAGTASRIARRRRPAGPDGAQRATRQRRRDGAADRRSRTKRISSPTSGCSPTPRTGRRIGEEFQNPLIVTGTVLFAPKTSNAIVQRDQEVFDSFGRRRTVPTRTFMERKGFLLQPKFVFIDGRTGATMYSEGLSRGDSLQRAAEHAGAVVVLRADGPAGPELPQRAQQPEDPRHARPAEASAESQSSDALTLTLCR